MSRLIARKGEKVTRENGEYICRLIRDLYSEDVPTVEAFEDWQIEAPKPGTPMDAYKPGESYIRYGHRLPAVVSIHLERGWSNETEPPEHSERP